MTDSIRVRQLRLCLTAPDYETALHFYRDVLGLPEIASYATPGTSPGTPPGASSGASQSGRVTILDAGRATLELADPTYAAYIDQVEVGGEPMPGTPGPRIRVAFEVADAAGVTRDLAGAGAEVIAPPTRTPWRSRNARLLAPEGLQLTIFADLDEVDPSNPPPPVPQAGSSDG